MAKVNIRPLADRVLVEPLEGGDKDRIRYHNSGLG